MKTLEEYNEDRRAEHEEERDKRFDAGVACSACGTELKYKNPSSALMSNPPKKLVYCPNAECKNHNSLRYKIC